MRGAESQSFQNILTRLQQSTVVVVLFQSTSSDQEKIAILIAFPRLTWI